MQREGALTCSSAAERAYLRRQTDNGEGVVDDDLHSRIEALVAEEHELRRAHASGSGPDEAEMRRLAELEVSLDRTWDLLRQRQARRDAGQDPAAASERSGDVVEGYLA
jgi:Protein of unknown function (DUF2630)